MDGITADLMFSPQAMDDMVDLYHMDSTGCSAIESITPTMGKTPEQEVETDQRQKGLPCDFCGNTFRRMPDLRQHRMACPNRPTVKLVAADDTPSNRQTEQQEPSMDVTPPKCQRTINQYGGIGSPAAVESEDDDLLHPVEPPYTFKKKGYTTYAKNKATDTTYEIKFNDQWQGTRLRDLHTDLHNMFE